MRSGEKQVTGSFVSTLEVGAVRAWRRFWPLKYGKDIPERLIGRAIRMGVLHPIWLEFESGLWMKCDIREMHQGTLISEGPWEPVTTQYILASLKEGQVFLDIGANAGYFTLLASRCVGQQGSVVAVEPNPVMTEQIRQNVARSRLTNVLVEQVACSAATEIRKLYLAEQNNTGTSSLCNYHGRQSKFVEVSCLPVDLIVEKHDLSRVDLVKIDVEGAELEVLRGMNSTLKRFRPKIIIELLPSLLRGFSVSREDVTDHLACLGYSISLLDAQHSNYLCKPS